MFAAYCKQSDLTSFEETHRNDSHNSLLPTPHPHSDQVFRITPSDEKKVHMLKKILGNMKVGFFCLSFFLLSLTRVCSEVSDNRSSGVWLSVAVRTLPVWMIVFLALCFLFSALEGKKAFVLDGCEPEKPRRKQRNHFSRGEKKQFISFRGQFAKS